MVPSILFVLLLASTPIEAQPVHRPAQATTTHEAPIQALAFSPDGRVLVSGDKRGLLLFRQSNDGALAQHWKLDGPIVDMLFDKDGEHLVVIHGEYVSRLSVADPSRQEPVPVPKPKYLTPTGLCFSADGKTLAVASSEVHLFDYPTLQMRQTIPIKDENGNSGIIVDLALSPDGRLLAPRIRRKNRTWIYDTQNLDRVESVSVSARFDPDFYLRGAVSFSPDGEALAVSGDNMVVLKNLKNGKTRTLWGHQSIVRTLAFSPDGRFLISAGEDQRTVVWQLPSGSKSHHWTSPGGVLAVAISPDSQTVATAGTDQAVHFWAVQEVGKEKPVRVFGTPLPTYNHIPAKPQPHFLRKPWILPSISLVLLGFILITTIRHTERETKSWKAAALLFFPVALMIVVCHFGLFHSVKQFDPFATFNVTTTIIPLGSMAFFITNATFLAAKTGQAPSVLLGEGVRAGIKKLVQSLPLSALILVGALLYTKLLFHTFEPTDFAEDYSGLTEGFPGTHFYVVANASVSEEIIYRMGFFVFFSFWMRSLKHGTFLAAVFSSILWSYLHLYNLDPLWLKWLQVFPFGMALCLLYHKYRIEACILVHLAFNLLVEKVV